MKRFISVICLFALIFTIIMPTAGQATDSLVTDKDEYIEGEEIIVTAEGEGKDWVGIYHIDDYVGTTPSIYWYYVAQDGNRSGDDKNIFDAEYTNGRTDLELLPADDYVIYLFANDGYDIISVTYITIITEEEANSNSATNNPQPTNAPAQSGISAPASVTYTREKVFPGSADGTLTITAASGSLPYSYKAYWANASGPLSGYTAFAPIECYDEVTEYQMVSNTLIPKEADRILVYAVKGSKISDPVSVMLPEGCNDYDFGTPLYEMQVMSDIHINVSQNHIHNQHFAKALEDIKSLSPNSVGIFINGDIADHSLEDEYKSFQEIINNAGSGTPPVYCSVGNHDLSYASSYEEAVRLFTQYTEPATDSIYFDQWINGVHFIYLGSEAAGLNAQLSDTQLRWFEEKLAENRDESRPIYVFLHQGLIDTVAGTFEYQKWHGINQSKEFADILKGYGEVILFSGHSHWEMDSLHSMKTRDSKLPTIFNTSSVAYLWNDNSMSSNIGIEGSQGYYIKAYEDKILVLGRDFVNGQWISSAQFVVMLDNGNTDNITSGGMVIIIIAIAAAVVIIACVVTIVLLKKRKNNM